MTSRMTSAQSSFSPPKAETELDKLPQASLDRFHDKMCVVINDLRIQTENRIKDSVNYQLLQLEKQLETAFRQVVEETYVPTPTLRYDNGPHSNRPDVTARYSRDVLSGIPRDTDKTQFRNALATEMINRGGSVTSTTGFGLFVHALNLEPHKVHSLMAKKFFPKLIAETCTKIVNSTVFDTVISIIILLNAWFTGLMTDQIMSKAMSNWRTLPDGEKSTDLLRLDGWMLTLDVVFAVVFTIELILRILSDELLFFCGRSFQMNLTELFLVAFSWVDIVFQNTHSEIETNLNVIRVIRVFRVVRSLRVVRVLALFKELRVVLLSLMGSVVPLFWALFCLFIILFVFVIIFMQGLVDFVVGQPGGSEVVANSVVPYFIDFSQSLCSLLMAITGGANWETFHRLMAQVSVLYSLLFTFYILVMTFGALNVITAIFVESATSKAREDSDVIKTEEMARARKLTKELTKLFRSFDARAQGRISLTDWEELSCSAEVQAYFSMLHIDIGKTREVFRLLDIDKSGYLDIEEFVLGCMQIQGSASSVNMEMLMSTTRSLLRKCNDTFDAMERHSCIRAQRTADLLSTILDRLGTNSVVSI